MIWRRVKWSRNRKQQTHSSRSVTSFKKKTKKPSVVEKGEEEENRELVSRNYI